MSASGASPVLAARVRRAATPRARGEVNPSAAIAASISAERFENTSVTVPGTPAMRQWSRLPLGPASASMA